MKQYGAMLRVDEHMKCMLDDSQLKDVIKRELVTGLANEMINNIKIESSYEDAYEVRVMMLSRDELRDRLRELSTILPYDTYKQVQHILLTEKTSEEVWDE